MRAVVTPSLDGGRLDRACTELLGGRLSRSQVSRRIREELVTVDGKLVTRTGHLVHEGQELCLAPLPIPEVDSALQPLILWEDEWLAVLDKPSGLPMHGNYVGDPHQSVARFLEEKYGSNLPTNQGAERPGIVHRLDKGTSGLCVVAFDQATFMDLQQQFADRTIQKEYQAICYGRPRFKSDWVEARLVRDEKKPERMRVTRSNNPSTRDASTYWEVLERFEGFCHILARPKTGRTHQIRVHLTSIDLPLVGDPFYRARNFGPGMFPASAPRVERTFLHASTLSFEHPAKGEQMRFESQLAEVMQNFLKVLRADLPAKEDAWS
ncbi:MAG TPA: RluA family pseudouridine synthase [Planctomycetota bacterium]|nr:RluA family pseudouridine synthase [Planctomycetota bacterium]HJM39877.1 RluA family pseudouridine synthase [Planctomycetota bacterium]